MTRQATVLAALVGVLMIAAFWFLLYQPGQEELAEISASIDDVQAQQVTTQQRIAQLEAIRADAPTIMAAISGAASLVPADTALPATLRLLQAAADDAGLEITALAPGTPTTVTVEEGVAVPDDLAEITIGISAEGSYFQVIDFLRRVEDPDLVARGMVTDNVSVNVAEYPDLTVTISGRMFANVVPGPDPEVVEPSEDPAADSDGDGIVDGEDPDANGDDVPDAEQTETTTESDAPMALQEATR